MSDRCAISGAGFFAVAHGQGTIAAAFRLSLRRAVHRGVARLCVGAHPGRRTTALLSRTCIALALALAALMAAPRAEATPCPPPAPFPPVCDCTVNGDCSSGLCVMRGGGRECVLPNGGACGSDAQCATGSCADGVCCSPGNVAAECGGDCPQRCPLLAQCNVDADCGSGLCVMRGGGRECVLPNGATCTSDPTCRTGFCVDSLCCSPGNLTEACGGDCSERCPLLAECNVDADCGSGLCVTRGARRECVLPNGAACTSDPTCRTGFCVDSLCCSPGNLTEACGGDCSERCPLLAECNVDADCGSGLCVTRGARRECVLPNGAACTSDPTCRTGFCVDSLCCSPGNLTEACGGDCSERCPPLAECNVDADCGSGLCVTRGASRECVVPNGGACTGDPQCRTGFCVDSLCCSPSDLLEECGGDCSTRCDNGAGCDVGGDCATRFCRDEDCAFAPAENGVGPGGCADDVDNDGDGRVDCVDLDCLQAEPCRVPAPALAPGGLMLALVGAVAVAARRFRRG